MAFDLAKGLNHVADNGFWPNVLFDDNGNWCIADEGSSNVRMEDGQDFVCALIGDASWFKPSLKEAWDNYIQRLIDFGNTSIDKNCAESPSPTIVAELVKALEHSIACLEAANNSGLINDTLWAGNAETLFDYMDAAIARAKAMTE